MPVSEKNRSMSCKISCSGGRAQASILFSMMALSGGEVGREIFRPVLSALAGGRVEFEVVPTIAATACDI